MDFLLDYGDLSIDKIEYDNQGTNYYDLSLETEDQFISKLVKRTLETPLGYIKQVILEEVSIDYLDNNYGNPLYKKLAEPLTTSFVLEAQADIENTLNSIRNVPGLTFNSVIINNYSLDSLGIEVNYSYNNQITTSQFNLPL